MVSAHQQWGWQVFGEHFQPSHIERCRDCPFARHWKGPVVNRCSVLDIHFCFLECYDVSIAEKLPASGRSFVTSFSGSSRTQLFDCSNLKIRPKRSFKTPVIIYKLTRQKKFIISVKTSNHSYLSTWWTLHLHNSIVYTFLSLPNNIKFLT
jgi:hypothetical protein